MIYLFSPGLAGRTFLIPFVVQLNPWFDEYPDLVGGMTTSFDLLLSLDFRCLFLAFSLSSSRTKDLSSFLTFTTAIAFSGNISCCILHFLPCRHHNCQKLSTFPFVSFAFWQLIQVPCWSNTGLHGHTMHITCMQTVLPIHKNLFTVLISV